MNEITKKKVCDRVYRKFPEMMGKQPQIQARPGGEELLIFHGSVKLETGSVMNRTVRVAVSEKGSILKITTSR